MGLLERGLAKLTLTAYQGDNGQKKIGSITAMYNPESISLDYQAVYENMNALNQHHDVSAYRQVDPPMLNLELILDSRGPRGGQPVDTQLSNLRSLCLTVGPKGEAPFLRVTWGKMSWHGHGFFAGRLEQLSVRYTLFDRNAAPLAARATLALRGESSDDMAKLKAGQPVSRQLVSGDDKTALPNALDRSNGASSKQDYLNVAKSNGLSNLSDLKAGKLLAIE
ncbi:hypothetical protein [Burkholderia stagnalis]|uniref:CIS tube protein n=1 Tax=Burkholderia stagnalis TaxID=1503054 RepID=UPI0007564073|nr:hypothetical protein [Burkholderia stagnalis]KWI28415.1 hypothetical protein WT71_16260 [Burkholderia stagnalis]KWI71002.1 hypothetical protein WT73_14045 [Burkholderia stagnalis]MDY7806686.1 hypothetical protein [Burkholderia stagnalis]